MGHPYHSKVIAVLCCCPAWLNNTLQVHLKHPFYSSVFPFISLFYGTVQMNNCGLMLPGISSYAARRTDQRDHHDWAAATAKQGLICILNAGRLRCLVFAETADDLPCSRCPLLNQGRIDLIASLAKGPAKTRPLPHCSMSRVQWRGKVNRVNRISLS